MPDRGPTPGPTPDATPGAEIALRKPAGTGPDWDLEHIPFAAIDRRRVRGREDLFYLVTAASFIEIAAELYSENLAHYFAGDREVVDWLQNRWEREELRHGRALRAYVGQVWPEFDWDSAYTAFFADYSRQCNLGEFEPTPGLELVARCVIETGTASFYEALAAQAGEPVLAGIAGRIRADEIGHYQHFYRFFRRYGRDRPLGRRRILAALGRRVREARRGDAECALWHAFVVRDPGAAGDPAAFPALSARLGQRVRDHYPVAMAVAMLLKPLHLPRRLDRAVQKPLARALLWMLH